ncbi:MAG: diacylglycerol kinase [Gammaproteobacteria bacterium]|nr:diacylglycerol kinase [Gammaproteobacteria bacterium]NIR84025.1 diacylglycerol kinase [Gammaproteobacteria bacterium]NIR89169.1 diacylglycerol kinase [Gammaproteobacteria bacterium]NIU04971.1 diacylglycerol kinase [Gammaproteobacteria bacterium]NIV52137.1 diacylglycerol kinase [Gammaproteobacteria bacterium]
MSSPKGKTGLIRIVHAFYYSMAGLRATFVNESAFRQELLAAAVLAPAAFILPVTMFQRGLLLASIMVVLITELLNSGIEATVDRISSDDDPLAKRAKDCGSAAVFLSLMNCLVVWILVLADVYA